MNLEDIRRSYSQATRRWIGCDWATSFGKAGLNLNGCTAQGAELRAHDAREPVEDWRAAARWLTQVEQFAERAEVQAALALAAANAGDLQLALEHAEGACTLEQASGRLEAASDPVWQDLRRAVASVLETSRMGSPSPQATRRAKPLTNELKALARTLEQLAGRVQELEAELEAARARGENLGR